MANRENSIKVHTYLIKKYLLYLTQFVEISENNLLKGDWSEKRQSKRVKGWIIHEAYSTITYEWDICLVLIAPQWNYNDYVKIGFTK